MYNKYSRLTEIHRQQQRAGQRRSCWCGEVLYCCVVCARAEEVLAAVRDLLILLRAAVMLVKSGAAV
jgi:hypothetical protein